jgi:hypothetical protein
MSKEEAIRDAEAFVRRAVSRISKSPLPEAAIREAAAKVAKVVPEKPAEKDRVAA